MRQPIVSIKIQRVALTDLPFEPGTGSATRSVLMQAEPEKDFASDGGIDPLDWMDLTGGLSRLIAADEVVLNASQATLVLWYPLAFAAIRSISPANGTSFTRAELVMLIDETYREIYRLEANSQSSATPPIQERGNLLNRPQSDGKFGIYGHDLNDLGIEGLDVHQVNGHIWLCANMCS